MATVINVPRDTRFGELGLGLAQTTGDLAKRRRTQKLMEVLNTLPEEATEQELVAQIAPFVDEPTDLVNVLLQGRIKRAQRKTPQEIAAEEFAKAKGKGAGEAANIEDLRQQEQAAREAKNIPRADRLKALIQKEGGKTLAEEAEEAEVKKAAELKAKREHFDSILGGPPSQVGTKGVRLFRGVEEPLHDDTIRVFHLLSNAQKLSAAGEFTAANAQLNEARFIIENSAEIQFEKQLDLPLSLEAASETGMPPGATLRDLRREATKLRSPEEKAAAVSEARKTGSERVIGREQLGFITQARTVLTDLQSNIAEDPSIVGVLGSLRKTGRAAQEVLSDLGAKPAIDAAKRLAAGSDDPTLVKSLFDDPTLSVLDIIEHTVGMTLARLSSDEGRIPVDIIKRSMDLVKLTGLTGSEVIQDRVGFLQDLLNLREDTIRTRLQLHDDSVLPAEATGFKREEDTGGEDLDFYRLNPETGKLELIRSKKR